MSIEISWNKEAIKTLSKAEFVKMHDHHKEDVDLGGVYDEINPPKVKEKPTQKVESADEK